MNKFEEKFSIFGVRKIIVSHVHTSTPRDVKDMNSEIRTISLHTHSADPEISLTLVVQFNKKFKNLRMWCGDHSSPTRTPKLLTKVKLYGRRRTVVEKSFNASMAAGDIDDRFHARNILFKICACMSAAIMSVVASDVSCPRNGAPVVYCAAVKGHNELLRIEGSIKYVSKPRTIKVCCVQTAFSEGQAKYIHSAAIHIIIHRVASIEIVDHRAEVVRIVVEKTYKNKQ